MKLHFKSVDIFKSEFISTHFYLMKILNLQFENDNNTIFLHFFIICNLK